MSTVYDEGPYRNWTAVNFPSKFTVWIQQDQNSFRQLVMGEFDELGQHIGPLASPEPWQAVIRGETSGASVDLRNIPIAYPGFGPLPVKPNCDDSPQRLYLVPSGNLMTDADMPDVGANIVGVAGSDEFASGVIITCYQTTTYNAGQALIQEGDMDSASMFVILKGQVEIRKGTKMLGKRGVGRAIGELALFTGDPRTADVVSLKRTICLELSREKLIGLIRQNPEIGVKMFDDMLFRLQEAQQATASDH